MRELISRGEGILPYNVDGRGEISPKDSSLEVIDVDTQEYILIKYYYMEYLKEVRKKGCIHRIMHKMKTLLRSAILKTV